MQRSSERLVGSVRISDHEELRVAVFFFKGRPKAVSLRPFVRSHEAISKLQRAPDWRELTEADLPLMNNRARRVSVPINQLNRLQELLNQAQNLVSKTFTKGPYAEE